jgi:hypothetical protein
MSFLCPTAIAFLLWADSPPKLMYVINHIIIPGVVGPRHVIRLECEASAYCNDAYYRSLQGQYWNLPWFSLCTT